ncbi:MAG: metal ABC transporter substrate-binding protein [Phycisphaerales bacterium]|jgi:ABC-type Zn uptake system ZnuABC Zn-binding protein ZnuA
MLFSALFILGLVTTQAAVAPTAPTGAAIKVVAGNDVVADLVRAIAGQDVELFVLGQGADPHHYEPTPADAKKIESADLVLEFGLGLDRAMGKLHRSTGSKAKLLVVAEGLAKKGSDAAVTDHADHADHDHNHDHGSSAVDPHIWHDPAQVRILNERMCAALVAVSPASAESFRSRSLELDTQLVKLDEWIKAQVLLIPESKRLLVTTHDGLQSFGNRYGFRVVGIEMTSDGADVAPSQLIKMVNALRETKSAVVFGDAAHHSRIAATVAREANVRLIETLRLDSLLQPPAVEQGKAYLETMRLNVNTIVKALQD